MLNNVFVNNVSAIINKNYIIKNLTLKFEVNKTYGIYGKNGVGKTTLLKILTDNFVGTIKGSIEFGNIKKNEIAYCPSNFEFSKNDTLNKFIKYIEILKTQKLTPEIISKMSGMFEINPDQKFKYMSSGMVQKSLIIQTLSFISKLYLFDEPLEFVDSDSKKIFWRQIEEIKKKAIVVVVSHDLEELKKYCDEVIIFENISNES